MADIGVMRRLSASARMRARLLLIDLMTWRLDITTTGKG